MDYETLQKMNRFAKFWDLYANSGIFKNFVSKLKDRARTRPDQSFFWEFYDFTQFLSIKHAQSFGISQLSLFESAYVYLIEGLKWLEKDAKDLILVDYQATGKMDLPKFLKDPQGKNNHFKKAADAAATNIPKRQQRHLAGKTESVS